MQLLPVGDAGVQGYALIERIALQRELDVTPTRVRIVLFAPPVTSDVTGDQHGPSGIEGR